MLEWLQGILGEGYTEAVAAEAARELDAALEAGELAHRQALQEKEAAYGLEIRRLKLEHAVDAVLLEAGARNRRAARALLNFDTMTVGEGEEIEGVSEQIEALKESDGYLFMEKEAPPPLQGICPAEGLESPGKSPGQMGYEELCAWFAESGQA